MEKPQILLAEDDIDDYEFFIEAFEKVSPFYQITRAKHGLECITVLKAGKKPDFIFLDLNMPIKSGLECLRFIKDSEELTEVPVIIYSTSHYIKDIDAAFKNGAHSYIVKPTDGRLLVEVLAKVMDRLHENIDKPTKENFVVRVVAPLET